MRHGRVSARFTRHEQLNAHSARNIRQLSDTRIPKATRFSLRSKATRFHFRSKAVNLNRIVANWAMLLNPDSALWTIDCQADDLNRERRDGMSSLVPIIFHATIASDDCFFSAFVARNCTRQHRALPCLR
jgi:hypothetical protein